METKPISTQSVDLGSETGEGFVPAADRSEFRSRWNRRSPGWRFQACTIQEWTHSSLACVYDVASVSTWLENATSKRERPPKLSHGFCLFDLTFAVPNDISALYVTPPPAKNSVFCTTSCEASHLFISNRRTLRPLLPWRCASIWRYPWVGCTDFGDSTTTAPRPRELWRLRPSGIRALVS